MSESSKPGGNGQAALAESLVNQTAIDREIDAFFADDAPSAIAVSAPEPPSDHPLTATLLEPAIKLPFDVASVFTAYDGWTLADKESKDLTTVWLPVLQRLLPKTESIDLLIAAVCTIGIVGMKTVQYRKDKEFLRKEVEATHKPKEEKPNAEQ